MFENLAIKSYLVFVERCNFYITPHTAFHVPQNFTQN